MLPSSIHIVTPEEYAQQCEAEEAKRKRQRTPEEFDALAANALEDAGRWRARIEREEKSRSVVNSATWSNTKAILTEVAEAYERDAASALAAAAELRAGKSKQ